MISGETIAAVATAPGRGGVAVVRMSGDAAFAVARKVASRVPEPGRFVFARLSDAGGRTIDEGLVLAFRAPRSYTGEDVVELQCHGGSVTPRRVLAACLAAGARLAQRGEFTQRAFLNGKMDLSSAESVIDLVDARTDRAADEALARLDPTRAHALRTLYDRALELSSTLEHALDVEEGELPDGFAARCAADAAALRDGIAAALARADAGRILRTGALVVLAGPPNAGKSSLLNALLGTARAIVSAVPGTTRDTLEELLDLDGWPVRLVDTAGLRRTDDLVESEGVRRAEALIAEADVVLRLLGESDTPPPSDARTLCIRSKCDILSVRDPGVLHVSAVTGEGLEALREEIVARIVRLSASADEAGGTPSAREKGFLVEAAAALARPHPDGDLVLEANAVRLAADALGRLVGATYSADLLDALFSRFCVGK